MLIAGFPAGAWATNCYVVAPSAGCECVVIDPGQKSIAGVNELVAEHNLKPIAVLLTHGHIDHIWSVAPVAAGYDIPALIHRDDRYRLEDPAGTSILASREQLLAMTEGALELTEPSEIVTFEDTALLELAGMSFRVAHAPGHTEGSSVFTTDGTMFSGDVLFAGSIGRTDLPGGDPAAMQASLQRVILTADDETVVLPGHGEATTIGHERRTNPFLTGGAAAMPSRGL